MLSLKTKPAAHARIRFAALASCLAACSATPGERPAVAPSRALTPEASASPRVTPVPQSEPKSVAVAGAGVRNATSEAGPSNEGDSMLPPAEAVGATNASLAVAPSSGDSAPRAALPSGTTVLHIGDSFAGALGIELNREFKEAGVRGILKYETATYIPTWAWGKDLEKYLSKYHPDLVLITLGANELEIPDPAQRAPTIRHLVDRLGGKPCVWVAPPLWHGARPALLDVIRESCAPCAYLDSSELVPELPRARDGIHPAMAARKEWAKAVITWLGQHRRTGDEQPWKLE